MHKTISALVMAAALCVGVAGAQPAATPAINPDYARRANVFGVDLQPVEPFRIVGNIYYVGTTNTGVYLITDPKGHILIDTGPSLQSSSLFPNIIKLGFSVKDIKVLLPTHAHVDHVQGFEYARRDAGGAVVMAMAADVPALEAGKDLSSLGIEGWEPIKVDRVLHDNDVITVGKTNVRAIWTPGHTPGSTAYIVTTEDGGRAYTVSFGGPPTPVVGNPKFDTRPEDALTSFKRMRDAKVDIMLPGHPRNAFKDKIDGMRAGTRPHPLLMAPGAWAKQIDEAEAAYKKKLAGG